MTGTIVVAGWLRVDAAHRDEYVAGCRDVVASARARQGCLDFSVTADSVDPTRVVVAERWTARDALEAFRGSGPDDDRLAAILEADVREYETSSEQRL